MLIALTGTPGVGKTTASALLREKYRVIDIYNFSKEHNLFDEYDEDAGSYNVDVDMLNDAIQKERTNDVTILDGHLSHFVDCDMIIVLRCNPKILKERLKDREYDEKKIIENVQSEVLDIILSESVDSGTKTYEIDCSKLPAKDVSDTICRIIDGDKSYVPGKIDWSEQFDDWF